MMLLTSRMVFCMSIGGLLSCVKDFFLIFEFSTPFAKQNSIDNCIKS
jgi:hypothetical protein